MYMIVHFTQMLPRSLSSLLPNVIHLATSLKCSMVTSPTYSPDMIGHFSPMWPLHNCYFPLNVGKIRLFTQPRHGQSLIVHLIVHMLVTQPKCSMIINFPMKVAKTLVVTDMISHCRLQLLPFPKCRQDAIAHSPKIWPTRNCSLSPNVAKF